jgi:hypothetical protein
MRHPFGGIISPDQKPADRPEIETTETSRRGLFGLAASAVAAGTVGLIALGTVEASAQRVTTLAVGEEGGRPPRPVHPTTRAIGEEGGRPPRSGWKK